MAAFGKSRVLIRCFAFLLLVFAVPFSLTTLQASSAFADDLSNVAYVETDDGSATFFKDHDDAWAYAKNNSGTMGLLKDWTTSNVLTVESGVKVAINLHGNMINRNNVDPSKPDYASDSSNSGSVFLLKSGANLTITSDVSTIAHNGDLLSNGRFWHYNKNGSTTIYGGLITGGATDSKLGGGGIALEEEAKLVMSNVTVAGNIADRYGLQYGYGGAISLYGENATAELTDCSLMYNYAQSGGGAVCVYDYYCVFKMQGGSISNNRTDNYGGGIYIKNKELKDFGDGSASVSLSTAEVSNNYADEHGGGIYLGGLGTLVSGGKITGNSAADSGGGIYVKQEDCGLNDCTVTNNEAGKKGGGVLIENDNSFSVPALYLTGTVVIKDNKVNNATSNLFLRNKSAFYRAAKIYGTPSTSSEIWVSAEEDGVISYNADSYNDAVFYTDDDSKIVYWETNSSDDKYRFLKIGNKSSGHSKAGYLATEIELTASEASAGKGKLQTTSYDYNGYPVYKGYSMEYSTEGSEDLLNAYYYSDGYFMESASNYNDHLASFALHLTCSAMNSAVFTDSRGNERNYTLQANHAKQMLSDIGVAEEDIFLSPTFFEKPTADSIACSIGSKSLENSDGSDSGVTLVTIAVRGAGYESEWASNVTLGGYTDEQAEHAGFAEAANTILNSWLEPYLEQRGLDEKIRQGEVRFLVTGFSRAGATSNLLSKRLIDLYEFPWMVGENHVVFGYTFEAPQGGNYTHTLASRSYNGIHNLILSGDLVPFVAMSSMNFQRYGVDHYLGGTAAGTASTDVITGEGAESEGQAKRYSRKYAGWLSHPIKINSDGKIVEDSDDWKSTHFMKDNDFYEVGSEEYEKQKDLMLKQLAACNGSIFFDDYFHLATLSEKSHKFTGHTEEIGSDNVTLAQYMHDFMFYVNAWLINDQNLQKRSAREHYITGFQREGITTSYQETARALMAAMFAGNLNVDDIGDKLSFDAMWEIVKCIFSSSSGDELAADLYNILAKYGVFGDDGIPLIQGQVIALMHMVSNFVAGDFTYVSGYSAGTSADYGADDEYLVMSGTLLYNLDRIILNHTPDVVCAWLRSADSYYTSDEEISTTRYTVASATSSEVSKPYLTMKVNGKEVRVDAGESCNLFDYDSEQQPTVTDIQLHTEDHNAGGMVFYAEGDASGVAYEDFSYFAAGSSNLFDGVTDWSDPQRLTAHTVWYNTPSDDTTFTIYYAQSAYINGVYVNDQLFGKFKEGETVVVPIVPEDEYHEFTSCTLEKSSLTPEGDWWKVDYDKNLLEFTMPGGDTYWKIGFSQKTVKDPVATPDVDDFEMDQFISFSTPSGTEDEGFTVSYSYYAYTADKLTDKKEISGTGTGGTVIYAIDGRESVWQITATASHNGWADSEAKLFILRVTPVEKTYTVKVLNGTLVEGGKATDKTIAAFKAGDTVTVAATDENIIGWESSPADLVQSDCKERTVSFTMPSKDVDIAAILQDAVVQKPTASIEGGSYVGTQTVELASETEGATIRYTTDGSEPDENSPLYQDPIEVAHSLTIKAKAYHENMKDSDTAEFAYVISHTVTFDTAGGSKIDDQTVVDGECVIKPADPKHDDFKFEGWFLEDGTDYEFSTPITSDLTLYAHWSAAKPSHKDGELDGDEDGSQSDGGGQSDGGTGGNRIPACGDDAATPAALLAMGIASLGASVFLRRRRS